MGMLRRELLSLFRAVYVFIARDYKKPTKLWNAVSRELFWMQSMICCVDVDLCREWTPQVLMFDASEWG